MPSTTKKSTSSSLKSFTNTRAAKKIQARFRQKKANETRTNAAKKLQARFRQKKTNVTRTNAAKKLQRTYKATKSHGSCGICLTYYNDSAFTRLSCGHKFHRNCIKRWLSKKNSCPNCRNTFEESEFRQLVGMSRRAAAERTNAEEMRMLVAANALAVSPAASSTTSRAIARATARATRSVDEIARADLMTRTRAAQTLIHMSIDGTNEANQVIAEGDIPFGNRLATEAHSIAVAALQEAQAIPESANTLVAQAEAALAQAEAAVARAEAARAARVASESE